MEPDGENFFDFDVSKEKFPDALRNTTDEANLQDTENQDVSNLSSDDRSISSQHNTGTLNEATSATGEQQAVIDCRRNNSRPYSPERSTEALNEDAFTIGEQEAAIEWYRNDSCPDSLQHSTLALNEKISATGEQQVDIECHGNDSCSDFPQHSTGILSEKTSVTGEQQAVIECYKNDSRPDSSQHSTGTLNKKTSATREQQAAIEYYRNDNQPDYPQHSTGAFNDETSATTEQQAAIKYHRNDSRSDFPQHSTGILNEETSATGEQQEAIEFYRNDSRPDSPQHSTGILNEVTSALGEQQVAIEWHRKDSRADSSQCKDRPYYNETCITNKQETGLGKLFDKNREQFIKGEWKNGSLVKLHYAQFKTGNSDYIRLYALDNLYTSNKNNFVARIMLYPFNIRIGHFNDMRKAIELKIVIVKLLDDDLQNKLEISREKFKTILKSKQEEVTVSRVALCDMFQLLLSINEVTKSYKYWNGDENINFLQTILKNKLFSQEFLNEAKLLYQDEKNYIDRNLCFPIVKQIQIKFSWKKCISENIKNSITILKTALINALPTRAFITSGLSDINKLSYRQLFTCNFNDIQLFSDLELSIRQHERTSVTKIHDFTQDYINKLWKIFVLKITSCSINKVSDKPVHTNAAFLQLFKTFLELQHFVCGARNESIINFVVATRDADLSIIANTQNTPGIHENRLKFIMCLMNHFKPGDVKKSAFSYQFFFFKVNETVFKRLTEFIINMFDTSVSDIAQEYVIWIYYIHKSFADLFYQEHEESNRSALYSFLNSLMELFISAVRHNAVTLEKVRILANSLIRFGTTISPYFLNQSFANENNLSILLQQAEYLKNFVTAYDQTVNDITNIIDIYQVFWDERRALFTELRKQYSLWPSALDELTEKFNKFIQYVFNLKTYSNKFLFLLRSYNEFMRLLRGTDFPWYLKKQIICSEAFVKLVDRNTNSYIVKDTDHFIQEYLDNSRNLPQHFLFDLTKNLINCVEEFLIQSDWEVSDKMYAAGDLLLLMGRSLINFNKLPNAVDFQHFYVIFTEPFKRVTQNSIDINDFKRRLGSLENYYKYTMELNIMSVDKALELCKQNNNLTSMIDYRFNIEQLNICYKVYLEKFNNYVEKYILQTDFNICHFAKKVVSKAKPLDIKKWDSDYKFLKLPKLLAGLSAVWSALESKDVVSQKQVIKPHCIQILCVLRLLAADKADCGVDSHLAQVLTGQGKSIVLSFLSAILALTGNRVRIVCYNKYLANRDHYEFQLFYRTLNIQNKINYGTFEEMANEIINPDINGKNYDLRKFVQELVTDDLPCLHVTEEKSKVSKTVLLIDEVDVFFSSEYYGNVYCPCTNIVSETIGEVQIKLWHLTANNLDISAINVIIQKYIDDIYLHCTDETFVKIVRNSRTILNTEIKEMISSAINVRNNSPSKWYYSKTFKLRDDGYIISIRNDGEHTTNTYFSYNNVFMYFKLKKENFEHKIFKNYGYLIVNCGRVSYALLPTGYSLILGVTGTLKQLSDAEMRAVNSYILRGSDMPTFFGSSKLHVTNFTIKSTEAEWTKAILDSILSIVKERRAVIVFFKDEYTIDVVRDKFASHLSRYSVLTGNESVEEVASCVEEAGVARKVTIATRRMGRGVDFKSNDSAVESKGGVHVIQTFWSEDVKEETQIKGRTARKDNSGSYETVLCSEHLAQAGYEDSVRSYSALSAARTRRAQEKGTELAQNIVKSQKKHDATMDFLKSFYNYNPDNRQEYLKKYPIVDV